MVGEREDEHIATSQLMKYDRQLPPPRSDSYDTTGAEIRLRDGQLEPPGRHLYDRAPDEAASDAALLHRGHE